ncbi:site-2 protease family protein [Phaeovibrio sulfidiphilus]|uniref:Site-2 protease family protein n=1 Tax=Phaeovibrio sulfidiphilus TaxID=1220600 RepID=A0A8J6YJN3_9PROT|nr:site-2 protease family protein [Phaeovibrio sulfidiphilus]MBE1237596.1 site-2 protease family protein [Phaeovibrio sulfidiphilus]
MTDFLTSTLLILPGLVIAITLHEAAHAYVASWLGDQTARLMGRLSLNPVRHIDPVGTLAVPGLLFLIGAPFLFGWAKPVPVDWRYLKHPRQDMALVALAGPCTNLILAILSALLIHIAVLLPDAVASPLVSMLSFSIVINCVVALLNLLPLPPLDGGRIVIGLLPERLAYRYARIERFGMPLLIVIMFLLPWMFSTIGLNVDPFRTVLVPLVNGLVNGISSFTGLVQATGV